MAQSLEPDEIDGDIYDEIVNLEKWQTLLSDLISTNEISQEEFDAEMLKSRYYIDIKTKNYVLDDEDKELIDNLREYKLSLTENYKYNLISEEEFNREYNNILKKEYSILKISESEDSKNKTVLNTDVDLSLSQKLEKIHQAEIKQNKSIAKKYNIPYPSLPSGFNLEQINDYYNLKITGQLENVITEIEDYIEKYSATIQMIGYYTTSFEVIKVFYDPDSKKSAYNFKMVQSVNNKLSDLNISDKRSNLLSPEEQAYSDRLNILKDNLRHMSRTDLLKCASVTTIKFMSYIERLRENKQGVIKFKTHPENYTILEKIIEEDNVYYNIPNDQLFKQYVYNRPDVYKITSNENENPAVEYLEKGNIGYLAVKEGADLKNLKGMEDFVTILPLRDELYTSVSEKSGDKTNITQVWELRKSLPGSDVKNIVMRYLSFENYLTEFREILVANSKKLTGRSRDILNSKIRKISYYLKYGEDPETYLSNGHTSVSDLFKKRSEIYSMRQIGLYKLLDLFTSYYPGSDTMIEKIEKDIFEYSSKNYNFNITKVIFLINNYQEKLDELIQGDLSIIDLLTYETPKTLPDDIDIRDDKQSSINTLLNWKPDTKLYDIYKSELENTNHNFSKFKKDHLELSNLQISQIMTEYSEILQWGTSLNNYNKLIVPDGYIELNFRLRYLLKQRNKLPSRRVFTLVSIKDRINNQGKFLTTFQTCKISEPKQYSILTENIIYSLSKTPEDYVYYNDLVNTEYKKLCDYFTEVNLKCELDSLGKVKCTLKFEPNVLTPIITEFLVTQGDFSTVDRQRLKNFTYNINSEKILAYIKSLRGEEIDSYNKTIIEQVNQDTTPLNEIYLKAIRIIKTAKMKKQLEELAIIANNTYKPPVVSVEKPVKTRFGKQYTPKYIKIGNYYVYGGFYPMFNSYNEDGSILKENYTRYDLEQLASIYDLTLIEDSFELYKSIMEFIYNSDKKDVVVKDINFNPVEYNTYYEYLKIPTKTINYTIRPRIGVKDPGEVYVVIKDQVKTYGVPFSFNEDTIPIYSEDLKERVDNGFLIIEGPCIFQRTTTDNALTSDSYINIEYKDPRGKSKMFREGVSTKKILKRKIDELNTCNRFITKENCDDINSYSLDIKGLKFKCKWLQEQCKGVVVESNEFENFDVNKIVFKDYSKNNLWVSALDKSIKYIEELVKLKELTKDEINILSKEQKLRLLDYYKHLNKPNDVLETIPEEKIEVKSYSLIDKFEDILKPDENIVVPEKNIISGYTDITIYNLTSTSMKLANFKRIVINSEYIVNGKVVIPREYNVDDNSFTCEIKNTDETIILYKEEFRRKTNDIIMKTVPLFCKIKNEDLILLSNLRGYYYYLKNVEYISQTKELIKKEEITKVSTVPTNFITPSSLLNGKPLISRDDIFKAIEDTAFSTLTTNDGVIYDVIEKVNANKDAITFAVKNDIDINKLFTKIIGTITIFDVIEEYERLNPKNIMTRVELTDILREAIENKDKTKIIQYYVRAKKTKIDKNIIVEAKRLLNELPDTKEVKVSPIPDKKEEQPKIEKVKNIYTMTRRRR